MFEKGWQRVPLSPSFLPFKFTVLFNDNRSVKAEVINYVAKFSR